MNNSVPLLLLLLLFLLSTSLTKSSAQSFSPSSPPKNPKTVAGDNQTIHRAGDNQTIHRASDKFCWGCLAESFQFLFAHNMVRAAHWELPLLWDSHLQDYANWWAGQRRGDCKLQHSFPEDDFKLGENVFWGGGSAWTPADAVAAWAEEEKYYHYGNNTCKAGEMCGHYTQIVWKSTRRVGCARVVCDNGDTFMTCNYDPPGNYIGEKPY